MERLHREWVWMRFCLYLITRPSINSPDTVAVYASHVRTRHRLMGADILCGVEDYRIKTLLKGIKTVLGREQRDRLPVSRSMLLTMRRVAGPSKQGLNWRAGLFTSYQGLLRGAEGFWDASGGAWVGWVVGPGGALD